MYGAGNDVKICWAVTTEQQRTSTGSFPFLRHFVDANTTIVTEQITYCTFRSFFLWKTYLKMARLRNPSVSLPYNWKTLKDQNASTWKLSSARNDTSPIIFGLFSALDLRIERISFRFQTSSKFLVDMPRFCFELEKGIKLPVDLELQHKLNTSSHYWSRTQTERLGSAMLHPIVFGTL